MTNFLKIMIGFWASGIVISIISQCYVSAVLCFVFLLNTISQLRHEKEYEATVKSIETTKKYIEKCAEVLKESK